jgi:hypothetical protein
MKVYWPGSVREQMANQLLVASTPHTEENELAGWIDSLRFPEMHPLSVRVRPKFGETR